MSRESRSLASLSWWFRWRRSPLLLWMLWWVRLAPLLGIFVCQLMTACCSLYFTVNGVCKNWSALLSIHNNLQFRMKKRNKRKIMRAFTLSKHAKGQASIASGLHLLDHKTLPVPRIALFVLVKDISPPQYFRSHRHPHPSTPRLRTLLWYQIIVKYRKILTMQAFPNYRKILTASPMRRDLIILL